MDFLYTLYDALVSIRVPSDKARAVVDAMERDMANTLATKAEIDSTRLLLKQEIAATRDSLKQEIAAVHASLKQEIAAVQASLKQEIAAVQASLKQEIAAVQTSLKQEVAALDARLTQKIDGTRDLLLKEMELLRSSMTIRLGTIQVVSLSLLFAALRLT